MHQGVQIHKGVWHFAYTSYSCWIGKPNKYVQPIDFHNNHQKLSTAL